MPSLSLGPLSRSTPVSAMVSTSIPKSSVSPQSVTHPTASNWRHQTRSGKPYSLWRITQAPEDFDYAALLCQSTTNPEELEEQDMDVAPSEAPA